LQQNDILIVIITVLEEKFKNYPNTQLIEIIELPQAYTPEAITVAQQILAKRVVLPASLKELADDFWKSYTIKHFKSIINNGVKLESHFLSDEEINTHLKFALAHYKERQELFEIDITKYWGAAL